MNSRICLASRSPRRRELLALLGFEFVTLAPDVDETPEPNEAPPDFVRRLALAKARAGRALQAQGPGLPVLAADTAVVADEHILGKPRDRAEALEMLALLSGRWHEVFTGIAVVDGERDEVDVTVTQVQLRPIAPAEARTYWDTGEPADKAGAYAIQGVGAAFVSQIHGSYTGVVGLPLTETLALLARFGVIAPVFGGAP